MNNSTMSLEAFNLHNRLLTAVVVIAFIMVLLGIVSPVLASMHGWPARIGLPLKFFGVGGVFQLSVIAATGSFMAALRKSCPIGRLHRVFRGACTFGILFALGLGFSAGLTAGTVTAMQTISRITAALGIIFVAEIFVAIDASIARREYPDFEANIKVGYGD